MSARRHLPLAVIAAGLFVSNAESAEAHGFPFFYQPYYYVGPAAFYGPATYHGPSPTYGPFVLTTPAFIGRHTVYAGLPRTVPGSPVIPPAYAYMPAPAFAVGPPPASGHYPFPAGPVPYPTVVPSRRAAVIKRDDAIELPLPGGNELEIDLDRADREVEIELDGTDGELEIDLDG